MTAPQPEQGQHHVPSYKSSDSELTIVPSPASPVTGAQTPTTSQSHDPLDLEANQAARQSGPKGPPGGWLAQHMSRNQEIAFNITICLVQLLPQACLTTCFPIIKTLVEDFGISDPAVLPWVVAAYALSFGTTILLAGRLGDIFGHKNVVMLGFIWLSLFSVVAGLSRYTSYEVFFAARGMQGLGSAMMNPNALALLGRSYPPNSKSKIIAFSAFGLCAPLGAYTGMLGSAVLGQLVHWSWSFYVIAITSAGLAVVARFSLPSPPKTPKQMLPFFKKLGSMDWLGGITGVGGLVAIQISLISAPVQGWNTQWVYMLLIIGIILVAFFVIVELKVSIEPLVPFRLLNSDVAFVLAAVACGWGTFGVWTYYLWRFLLGVWNDSPLQAALHVLPIVPVALIAAVLTAFLMRKTQPAWILLGALIAFTLGPTFLATNTTTSPYWTFTFLSLLVTPFGMDMSFPSATFVMSNSLPIDKQGVGGSLVTTVVNYSISLGLGLASTVEVRTNDNGRDMFRGFHSAWIFGLGLGLIGIVVCVVFVLKSYLWPSLPTTPLGLATVSRVAEQPITRMKRAETFSSSTSTVVADSGREKITPPGLPVIPEEYVKSG
ncbi:multidrug-resistance type transporter aminotriazole resistance [Lithohypha guttulata]|uniref:Multidrug-resistance type transporter aminotriazole resistance n=1 Tax=Lithohypha guttulata TaxID=1690604 RepID=A0AAN7T171_9EURO|nr:multidrug-resistance type transporter aminotriazole resistance [Lithohypha guttulata]